MKRTLLLLGMLVAWSGAIDAQTSQKNESKKSFFEDRERGWFWYEDPVEEERKKPKPIVPVIPPTQAQPEQTPKEPETISINVQWLRDNIQRIQDQAVNNPTDENLAQAAYAQRLMLDYSTRFSTKMMNYMSRDPLLDESVRRPTTAMNIKAFATEAIDKADGVLASLAEKAHIWFFYRSDCGFCHKQIPTLKALQDNEGFTILAISMDGKPIPGIETFEVVNDVNTRLYQRMGVDRTPSLFLVGNKREFMYPVSVGLKAYPQFKERLLLAAKETGMISDSEYEDTQMVRELNVFENKNGEIIVQKDKLENDPNYLTDILRAKLANQVKKL
ncbi:MAG: hypothetical protein GJ680_07345 [Alteromonadaceae bacterium]|nr:hypothetical protein [Alteromonadaceae bacterium]